MPTPGHDVVRLGPTRARQERSVASRGKLRRRSCQQARGGETEAATQASHGIRPSSGLTSDASTQAGAQLESPAWFVHQQQTRPRESADPGTAFDIDVFHKALEASQLKDKVRATMLEMLHGADQFGRTTVSGRRLAASLRIREATVSSHLNKAREAGFLLTKYRYNKSPVQQLAWPGSGIHPPQLGISPLSPRIWTDGEVAWWRSLDTNFPLSPPWGEGEPPF